jgi:hypothetical protein
MDDIARDYLVLALSIGQLQDGIVDAYFGPEELRMAAVAADADAASLAERAADLRESLPGAIEDSQRRHWLDRQLTALETLAQRLAGAEMPYLVEVERCFDARPERTPSEVYAQVRWELDGLLPGQGDLRRRLEDRDARLTVPEDRLSTVVDWLVGELRETSREWFGLPAGESLGVELVKNQPWSAYNWYDGGLRSRIEINTDLPARAPLLIGSLAHETFPGHHLEHTWKETRLVRELGRGEATAQLVNTPEAYISEGLAEVGAQLAAADGRWQALLLGICDRAGIELSPEAAEREWQISQSLRRLRASGGDAALMLHFDQRPRDEVIAFLERDALRSREQAEKNIEFIGHPLWRTYVFCYAGGERLLGEWVSAAGEADAQRARFFRLLTEQLTPSGIAAGVYA